MCLVDKGFKKEQLNSADGYQVVQTEHSTTYRNLRLIRANLPWRSLGVTHEYTCVEHGESKIENFDTIFIDDRSDGGAKAFKLERDAAMLIKGLEEEKDNSRYMFYLANTFLSLNQILDAIYWYEKRIEDTKNTFEEERWYAMYKVGQCYELLNDWPKCYYWYMKAINRRPHRLEPYLRMARIWILNDKEVQYYNGCQLIKQGLAMARPEIDVLFVEDTVYDHEAWFLLSVGSYYVGKLHEGKAASIRVLNSKAPPHIKALVQKQLLEFYNV
jgi:tetratricopeptide (TPR) repeat protein